MLSLAREYINKENTRIDNILYIWLKAIDFSTPIVWNHDKDDYQQINIFTNRPGILIGCRGQNVEMLRMMVKKYNYSINIIEMDYGTQFVSI